MVDVLATPPTGRVPTPWNLAPSPNEVAVVEVAGADDVPAVLRYASAHGLEVVVRCTGHGAADRARPTLVVSTVRNYEPPTLARLGELAARYDPHGVLADSRVVRAACLTGRDSFTDW